MALQALSPAMVSVAIVLGCWGISGQPLGMLHLVGMLLAVAICVDYGIFFVENRADNMRLTYQAIVVSAITTMAAFSSLGLAENPALQTLAWTIAPGVFFGFFLCPLLIRVKQVESPDQLRGE
jgi:predicted exporter